MSSKKIQTDSKPNKINSNYYCFKKDLPEIEKFEIKYGFEGFEEWNNFLYINFFRLEVNFE
jgi:hypothetical protein